MARPTYPPPRPASARAPGSTRKAALSIMCHSPRPPSRTMATPTMWRTRTSGFLSRLSMRRSAPPAPMMSGERTNPQPNRRRRNSSHQLVRSPRRKIMLRKVPRAMAMSTMPAPTSIWKPDPVDGSGFFVLRPLVVFFAMLRYHLGRLLPPSFAHLFYFSTSPRPAPTAPPPTIWYIM